MTLAVPTKGRAIFSVWPVALRTPPSRPGALSELLVAAPHAIGDNDAAGMAALLGNALHAVTAAERTMCNARALGNTLDPEAPPTPIATPRGARRGYHQCVASLLIAYAPALPEHDATAQRDHALRTCAYILATLVEDCDDGDDNNRDAADWIISRAQWRLWCDALQAWAQCMGLLEMAPEDVDANVCSIARALQMRTYAIATAMQQQGPSVYGGAARWIHVMCAMSRLIYHGAVVRAAQNRGADEAHPLAFCDIVCTRDLRVCSDADMPPKENGSASWSACVSTDGPGLVWWRAMDAWRARADALWAAPARILAADFHALASPGDAHRRVPMDEVTPAPSTPLLYEKYPPEHVGKCTADHVHNVRNYYLQRP